MTDKVDGSLVALACMYQAARKLYSNWHYKLLPCRSRYADTVEEMQEAYPELELNGYLIEKRYGMGAGHEPRVMVRYIGDIVQC